MKPTIELTGKKEIGDRFRAFREENNFSLEELGAELGVNPAQVAEMEAGNFFLGIDFLYHCRTKLGLKINWLIGGKGSIFSSFTLEIPVDFLQDSDLNIEELRQIVNYPPVQRILLGKLLELKYGFKERLEDFLKDFKKKGNNAAAMTVPKPAARRRQDRFTDKEQRDANPATPA
jgi:transcriptional regulator with XRE-family HTH domain